jgi:hypothetical protein
MRQHVVGKEELHMVRGMGVKVESHGVPEIFTLIQPVPWEDITQLPDILVNSVEVEVEVDLEDTTVDILTLEDLLQLDHMEELEEVEEVHIQVILHITVLEAVVEVEEVLVVPEPVEPDMHQVVLEQLVEHLELVVIPVPHVMLMPEVEVEVVEVDLLSMELPQTLERQN